MTEQEKLNSSNQQVISTEPKYSPTTLQLTNNTFHGIQAANNHYLTRATSMTYKLNDKQFDSISKLADDKRFEYFLKKVADWEEIWSLHSPEGWVELSSGDGEICLPVWPHPDFAAAWAVDDWADCTPKAIKLDVWLERWTPGLEKDDTVLAIFPVDEEEGFVLTPSELEEAVLAELES